MGVNLISVEAGGGGVRGEREGVESERELKRN